MALTESTGATTIQTITISMGLLSSQPYTIDLAHNRLLQYDTTFNQNGLGMSNQMIQIIPILP